MRQEIILDPERSGEGPAPLDLFWGLENSNGEVVVQYDLETGVEKKVPTADFAEWSSLVWIPFREPEWIEKINTIQDTLDAPSYVEASPLPLIQVIPKKGELARITRRGFIDYFEYYECTACDTTFKWTPEETEKIPVCPKCGMHNIWTCDLHGEVDPIFLKNGEHRCPDCEKTGIPRGCNRIRNLVVKEGLLKRIHYLTIIKDKVEIEVGEDRVIVRSL